MACEAPCDLGCVMVEETLFSLSSLLRRVAVVERRRLRRWEQVSQPHFLCTGGIGSPYALFLSFKGEALAREAGRRQAVACLNMVGGMMGRFG